MDAERVRRGVTTGSSRTRLVVVRGNSGSGKTSVARPIRRERDESRRNARDRGLAVRLLTAMLRIHFTART